MSHFSLSARFCLALLIASACGESTSTNAIPPLADAGPDFRVNPGTSITLDGSNSIAGTDPIDGFIWTLSVRPEGSSAVIVDSRSSTATFVPDQLGTYVVTLIVSAAGIDSRADVALISAEILNQPPNLVLGCLPEADCAVLHGQSAQLNSQLSIDPEGDAFTVVWSQITSVAECSLCPALDPCLPSPELAPLDDPAQPLARFTAPSAKDLTLVFRAEADDGRSTSSECIVYTTFNTAPTAQLAPTDGNTNPTAVDENSEFVLDASASFDSDAPDNANLTFEWSQISGPTVTLPNSTLEVITLTAPDLAAAVSSSELLFQVIVSDGIDERAALITVTVQNL